MIDIVKFSKCIGFTTAIIVCAFVATVSFTAVVQYQILSRTIMRSTNNISTVAPSDATMTTASTTKETLTTDPSTLKTTNEVATQTTTDETSTNGQTSTEINTQASVSSLETVQTTTSTNGPTTVKPVDDPVYFYFPKILSESVLFDEADPACKRAHGEGYMVAGRNIMNKGLLQVVNDMLAASSADKVWLGAYLSYSISMRTVLWADGSISRPAGAPWCGDYDTFANANKNKKIPIVLTKANPTCLTLYLDDVALTRNSPICLRKEPTLYARNVKNGEMLVPAFLKDYGLFDEKLEVFPDIGRKMNCLLDGSVGYCDSLRGESKKTYENAFAIRNFGTPLGKRFVVGLPLLVDYATALEICSRMRTGGKDSPAGRIIDEDLITLLNENNVTLNGVTQKEFRAVAVNSINKLVQMANNASIGALYRTKREEFFITTTGYMDVSSAYMSNPPPVENEIYQVSWVSSGGQTNKYHVNEIEKRTSIPVCKNAYINLFNSTIPFKYWRDTVVSEPYKSNIVSRLSLALSSEPFETLPCWRFALNDLDWPGIRAWIPGCQLESTTV